MMQDHTPQHKEKRAQEEGKEQKELAEAYRQRFQHSFGTLDSSALVSRSRAIIGTDQLPATPQGQLALSGLDKLRIGADPGPTPAEFAALEYMIRAMRPAPLFQNGQPEAVTDADFLAAFPLWTDFGNRIKPLAGSIGRISRVTEGGAKLQPQGTGFLVGPGLLMTNTHVLDALSNGVRELEPGQAVIEMRCEAGIFSKEPRFPVVGVAAVHDTQDACLLRVDGLPDLPSLQLAPGRPATMSQVAAIGFPYPDPLRDPLFVAPLFGMQQYGFKRAAPGLVTGFQDRTETLYHDCSTLGGNSGSPVLSLADCTVVGLHRGGGFLWKNVAVESDDLTTWLGAYV